MSKDLAYARVRVVAENRGTVSQIRGEWPNRLRDEFSRTLRVALQRKRKAATEHPEQCGDTTRSNGTHRNLRIEAVVLVGGRVPDYAQVMLQILTLLALVGASPDGAPAPVCADGPPYYAFELVTTKNIPGTGLAKGTAEVAVSGASPFSVSLGADGSYVYDLTISLERMRTPRQGTLVAWVTTPEIDRIERIGALDEHLQAKGPVSWNKFIVVITLEADGEPTDMWSGPIVFRGMSRSGMMHTMVGHGALQEENCAAFGYGN